MTWKCFRLVFRLETPLHIGYGAKLGIIDRTRYYVLGKTFWGAVVSKLAQKSCGNFESLKEFVKENLIFSYFYLSTDKEGNQTYIPRYTEEGLKYGDMNVEEFENKFITSYLSTSIDKSFGKAEEGSLHEIELIKNKLNNKDIFLIGYLFVRENSGVRLENCSIFLNIEGDKCFLNKEKGWELFDLIKNLQIGGERNYGFGRIVLENVKSENYEEVRLYNTEIRAKLSDLSVIVGQDREKSEKNAITSNEEYTALSHVKIDGLKFVQLKGDLEPLVTREWSEKGAGQNPNFEGVCLVPGSLFKLEENQKIKIGAYGIWQINGQPQNKS